MLVLGGRVGVWIQILILEIIQKRWLLHFFGKNFKNNSVVQKNLSDQMRIFSIHDLCAFVGAVTQYSY